MAFARLAVGKGFEVVASIASNACNCVTLTRMATLTIRNLDETVKRRLQVQAALNGRSMEAEARAVLSESVEPEPVYPPTKTGENLGIRIHNRFAKLGGVELQIPRRGHATEELKDGLGTAIHRLFSPLGGVDIELPSRKSHRKIPTYDE